METTYRVTVMHLLRVAPIRKTTYEGVSDIETAMELAVKEVHLEDEDAKSNRVILECAGAVSWSYAFDDVAIQRESQAAPQEDATTRSNICKGECKWESDPQPHNQYQSKCPACGDTMPF